MRWIGRLATLVLLAILWPAAARAAFFAGLEDFQSSGTSGQSFGLSADGSVVVGWALASAGPEAFRWTPSGMVGLGDLPGGAFESRGFGASADGSVVAGWSRSTSGIEAFRWTSGGMVGLGDLPGGSFQSLALGGSADGTVIVGQSSGGLGDEAFRWTSSGLVGLGDLPGGAFNSLARGASADGSVVVGHSEGVSGLEAFRWTSSGMVGLGDLPGGLFSSIATAVSADGTVVVGRGNSAAGNEAFRWTSVGMVGLGDLPGGAFLSAAEALSADGSVVVGRSASGSGDEAFVWDAANGMRSLRDLLVSDHGLGAALAGWTLTQAAAVSTDGLVFAGWGTNPDGDTEAWVASVRPDGFVSFEPDAAGAVANGFTSADSAIAHFSSSAGAGLAVDASGTVGHWFSQALTNTSGGTDSLIVDFDVPIEFVSMLLGGEKTAGEVALLQAFLGGVPVGSSQIVLDADALANQLIAFSGADFDRLVLTYVDDATLLPLALGEGIDQLYFIPSTTAPVPEPGALSLLLLAGGAALVRRRRAA